MTTPARPEAQPQGSLDELLHLLTDFDAAMLVTLDAVGRLRARPMGLQLQERLPDCDPWLATAGDAPKIEGLAHHHAINLFLSHPRYQPSLSLPPPPPA